MHGQAIARGIVPPGDASRLRWVAGCEHARRVGVENPPGLFAAMVRGGHWGRVTQADEDRARLRLREFERPRTPLPTAIRPAERMPLSPYATQCRPSPGPSSLGGVLARLAVGARIAGAK